MKYKHIKEAVFLSRPNRFIAKAAVDDEIQTVHVKNTGRCRELLIENVKVFLEDHGSDHNGRKTRYSLIAVVKENENPESAGLLINIDSQAPNKVVGEALARGCIVLPGLTAPFACIKPETAFGTSRFDFYVEDREGTKAFIEVKGVTLEDGGVVRFPDAPTKRGIKHVSELCIARTQGFNAYVIFVVQMKGVSFFEPNEETHPAFGEALRKAQSEGVVIIAYDCEVSPDSLQLSEPVEVRI